MHRSLMWEAQDQISTSYLDKVGLISRFMELKALSRSVHLGCLPLKCWISENLLVTVA